MGPESTSPSSEELTLIKTNSGQEVLSGTGEISPNQAVPHHVDQDHPHNKTERRGRQFGRTRFTRRKALGLMGAAATTFAMVKGVHEVTKPPVTFDAPNPANEQRADSPVQQFLKEKRDNKGPLFQLVAHEMKDKNLLGLLPRFRKYYEQYRSQQSMIERSSFVEKEIQEALNDPRLAALQLSEQDKMVFGMIFLPMAAKESSFNPQAENGATHETDKAIGLLQVKNNAAREAARRLGIDRYDLTLARDNVVIATALMHRYRSLFPSLGLAIAAYNLGEGKVGRAIQKYAIEDLKIPRNKVDRDFSTMGLDGKSPPATAQYTRDLDLTLHDLIFSENVVRDFKVQGYEEYELDYYDQVVAWAMVLKPDQFKGFTDLMITNTDAPKENIWQKVRQIVRR